MTKDEKSWPTEHDETASSDLGAETPDYCRALTSALPVNADRNAAVAPRAPVCCYAAS